MLAVVASALAARRGQAIIIALVGLLACAAVAAAPWYAVAATQQVGVAAVEGAPAEERVISVIHRQSTATPGVDDPIAQARREFEPAGFTSVTGAYAIGNLQKVGTESPTVEVNLAQRDGVCDQILLLDGSCPSAQGEVLLSATAIDELGVKIGDELQFGRADTDEPMKVRIVGTFQLTNPTDTYWGDGSVVGTSSDLADEPEPAFTVVESMPERATFTYELLAEPQAFATMNLNRLATTMEAGLTELRRLGYSATTGGLDALTFRIAVDRQNVTAGIAVGVAALLLLTWFTLIVVLREAVTEVRTDVGWWRLHGAPTGRGWVTVMGQSVVPLVGGALVGTVAGVIIGRTTAADIADGAGTTALLLTLLLVGLTVGGGLVAVVASQLGILRTPVRDLLRRIPARRGGWRRSLIDLVLVVLAVAAVGQVFVAGSTDPGLTLLAPALAVLAIAMLAARAVQPLVAKVADDSLHAGRLGLTLIAASMARRPGVHRLFALVSVAVALMTTAFVGWDTAVRTEEQRAALETGASKVLTVAASDTAQLLAAVRSVDPEGGAAMAAVARPSIGSDPSMLAVDTTRLGIVEGWRAEFGDLDAVAAALRPAAPDPVLVETERLAVEAATSEPQRTPIHLRVRLRTLDTGAAVEAVVGPLTPTAETYEADVPCADGCRLVGVQVLGAEAAPSDIDALDGYAPAADGVGVDLFQLGGADTALNDAARWRTGLGPRDLGPIITTNDESLRLSVAQTSQDIPLERDDWSLIADTPTPLPVLTAGWRPDDTEEARLAPLAGAAVPIDVVRTASLIPRFGGLGAIADLEYAERMVPFALAGGTPQVWLSASAPASIVDDLEAAGLTVLSEEALAEHADRFAAEGSAVGVRFRAIVSIVGVLLAAGAILVHMARERPGRAAELTALRAQGIDAKVIAVVGYGGPAAVIGVATVIGIGAGLVGALISRFLDPGFVDGWAVLAPAGMHPLAVLGSAAVAVVVLGTAVVATSVALVRRTRPMAASEPAGGGR